MSTTHHEEPQFEEVFGPEDVADLRRRLKRGRFWRLLNLKDRLLKALGKAVRSVARRVTGLATAARVAPVAAAAGRVAAGVWSGLASMRAAVRAAGVVPVTVSLLTTGPGRKIMAATWRTVTRGAGTVSRFLGGWAARAVALVGPRARRFTDRVSTTASRVTVGVLSRTAVVWMPLSGLLPFAGMFLDAAGAWGRQRALRGLLTHLLPTRWARLARLLTTVLLIPAGLRAQLRTMVTPPTPEPPLGKKEKTPLHVVTTPRSSQDSPEGPQATAPVATTGTGPEAVCEPQEAFSGEEQAPANDEGVDHVRVRSARQARPHDERTGGMSRYPAKKQRSRR